MNSSNIDLPIIKLMMNLESYESYYSSIDKRPLSEEATILLQDFEIYYNKYGKDIDLVDFYDWFCNIRHKGFSDVKKALFKAVLESAISADTLEPKHLLSRLKYEQMLDEFLKNSDTSPEAVKAILDKYADGLAQIAEPDNVQDYTTFNLDNVFNTVDRSIGLNWRLSGLQKSIGGLIRGYLVVIAAYTDTGKTAFVASEATHMATQMKESKVLWFNNEGSNERVQIRLLCSALNRSQAQINENKDRALVWYKRVMGGDENRILVYPAHGKSTQYITDRCKAQNCGLIVIDQLDNIDGFGKKENEVIKSRYLYQWARELATEHAPLLAVTQASGNTSYINRATNEEEYQLYLGMHQLDWSKVAKQSAAEMIITIGRSTTLPNQRGISVPKNKSNVDTYDRNPKFLCNFNGATSRYED